MYEMKMCGKLNFVKEWENCDNVGKKRKVSTKNM